MSEKLKWLNNPIAEGYIKTSWLNKWTPYRSYWLTDESKLFSSLMKEQIFLFFYLSLLSNEELLMIQRQITRNATTLESKYSSTFCNTQDLFLARWWSWLVTWCWRWCPGNVWLGPVSAYQLLHVATVALQSHYSGYSGSPSATATNTATKPLSDLLQFLSLFK